MARKKSRRKARRNARRSAHTAKRTRRKGRGRGRGMLGKIGVATPNMEAVKIGAAMAAGEVLLIVIEGVSGFDVPDWIPTKSLGLFAYAVLVEPDAKLQQVAYALAVAEFIEGTEVFESAKEQAASIGQ